MLNLKRRGHDAYYGVTGSYRMLSTLRWQVAKLWRQWLGRRNRGRPPTWDQFDGLLRVFPLAPRQSRPLGHVMNPQPRGIVCTNRARTDLWGRRLTSGPSGPIPEAVGSELMTDSQFVRRGICAIGVAVAVLGVGAGWGCEPDTNSRRAVAALRKFLDGVPAERPALGEQRFAAVALRREDASEARKLLWDDHVRAIKETRAGEMQARRVSAGGAQMPFHYSVTGRRPESGRSLYLSMHGGGGAPKHVNNAQWENQKRLYRVPEGVYLAPRAPTDSWDMWHKGHIDVLFDRLIENLIVFEGVNPNRVYLMGYSAGGDGVYRLAPRMADRFAAASMMAGHPGNASPLNLRNTPFSIHVGANDGAYNRNNIARDWGKKLDNLQKKDPGGYVHWTMIHGGKGHWVDGQDAAAIPWMAKHTRNPLPERIVWRRENHARFYWLAAGRVPGGAVVRATRKGQEIDLQAGADTELLVRVNDRMLDLDREVTVRSGGRELFKGRIERTIAMLARTLAERGDPAAIFSGEISVSMAE